MFVVEEPRQQQSPLLESDEATTTAATATSNMAPPTKSLLSSDHHPLLSSSSVANPSASSATAMNSTPVAFGGSGGEDLLKDPTTGILGTSTTSIAPGSAPIALVRRRFCGTGPFDRHWFVLDCCGIFCALLTYFLHLYGIYAVCVVLVPPWLSYTVESVRYLTVWGHIHRSMFTLVALLAMASHFRAMTTDPGAVPPDAKPLDEHLAQAQQEEQRSAQERALLDPTSLPHPTPASHHLRLCRRCRAYKPQRAHHCSICRRCVIKMDHHCPWINNCCAIGNHKYFLLFIMYTFCSCLYSLSLLVWRFTSCMGHHHHMSASRQQQHSPANGRCFDDPTDLLKVLGLLVESVLFGLFTMCMMCDQSGVVSSRITHIDRLKGLELRDTISGVAEVFGVGRPRDRTSASLWRRRKNRSTSDFDGSSPSSSSSSSNFRLDWLSPFSTVCWGSLEQDIMGYCRPVSSAGATASSNVTSADPKGIQELV
jgi:palmitoyltransferase ZDHHC3/7/25